MQYNNTPSSYMQVLDRVFAFKEKDMDLRFSLLSEKRHVFFL